jgi:hypothetical protein
LDSTEEFISLDASSLMTDADDVLALPYVCMNSSTIDLMSLLITNESGEIPGA